MYPLSNQEKHPRRKSSPEASNFRTHQQHPDTRNNDCQRQGHGNNAPDSRCEQRVHNGQEIFPKATVDWRMTKASSQSHRGCHDQLEEGGPERNRTRQYHVCHRDHEEAATPHVVTQEAHAAVSAGDNKHHLSSRRP